MMNNDDSIKTFQRLLKLRTIFKQISQLSWNITSLEKRYPIDGLSGKEAQELLNAYKEYAEWLNKINDELNDCTKG